MIDEGYVYVDVRTPEEFAEGRPEGAVNVPLGEDFVARISEHFETSARIIVGCKAGGRSFRATTALFDAGYTNVCDQRAGYDGSRGSFGELSEPGWSRVGLPVERG